MSLVPRDYQRGAIDAILARFNTGPNTLAVMATGTGKTVVAAHVADRFLKAGRVMVLAHRDELIRQACDKFRKVTGVIPAVEKAGERCDEDSIHGKAPIVVSSFQTQNSGAEDRRRMHKFKPAEFSFLWVDEAHHAVAESFRRVIDYYTAGNPALKVLYVTATPDRADGEALGQVCDSVACTYELPDAILDGYLVPVRRRGVIIEGLDFSKCRTTAGDLNAADLETAMLLEKPFHGVAHATIESACGLDQHSLKTIKDDEDRAAKLAGMLHGKIRRRALVFCVGVAHAEKLAEILNRWLPKAADWVDGSMPMEVRRDKLARFASGDIQFLCNCMIASEGFDDPGVEMVVQARPTKSRALCVQQIGRGTRPLEEVAGLLGTLPDAAARRAVIEASRKRFVEILDFVGNSGRHKLVTAIDILGGNRPDAILDRAKEIAEEDAVDVAEAIAEAEMEEDARREGRQARGEQEYEWMLAKEEAERLAAAARRAGLVGTATYHVREMDTTGAAEPQRDSGVRRAGASMKQIAFLEKLGVRRETAAGYSMRQASAVIEDLKQKTCSSGQRWKLRQLNFSDVQIRAMNFAQASQAIDTALRERIGAA